jgi:DNA-binding response OmpR family regulator
MPRAARLLIVGATRDYADALTAAGYQVTAVPTLVEALKSGARPHAIIVELVVPDGDLSRISAAAWSGRRTRAMAVIALTAHEHRETVVKAGATFCRHPCPPEELVGLVEQTLAERSRRRRIPGPPRPRRRSPARRTSATRAPS